MLPIKDSLQISRQRLKVKEWQKIFHSNANKQTNWSSNTCIRQNELKTEAIARDKEGHSAVQSLSFVSLFATPQTAVCQLSWFFTVSWSLLKLMCIELAMPPKHLILCHPLILLPSIFPGIRVFSNELALRIRWPKYWSFSFSISPSNEYSGLISFRIDWFDFLAVQGLSRVPSNTRGEKHQFFRLVKTKN